MRRSIIVLLVIACMALSVGNAFAYAGESLSTPNKSTAAISFSDVKSTHWAYTFITKLAEKSIIGGYKDGTFRPEGDITRAEFAKIIVLASSISVSTTTTSSFNDVSANDWAVGYIEAAKKAGVIGGYPDGTFKPENKVTRAEIAKMVMIASKLKSAKAVKQKADVSSFNDISGHWAYDFIVDAAGRGFIGGYLDGSFGPDRNATRAEVAKIIYKAFFEVLGVQTPDEDTPVVTITSPTDKDEYSTSSALVSLSGTASDNEQVTSVSWENRSGGQGTAQGTTNWSAPNIALKEGANLIIVTARDNKGNTATDFLKVVYTPSSDGGGGSSGGSSSKPVLQMTKAQEYWANYSDYQNGEFTVEYKVSNTGTGDALSTEIRNIAATTGVTIITEQPISLATIAAGSSANFTVKYKVPGGVTLYDTSLGMSCEDEAGNSYSF